MKIRIIVIFYRTYNMYGGKRIQIVPGKLEGKKMYINFVSLAYAHLKLKLIINNMCGERGFDGTFT